MRKLTIFLIIVIILAGFVGWFVHENRYNFVEPQNLTAIQESSLFAASETNLPSASWSNPEFATTETTYGDLSGNVITGKVTSDQAMVEPFENKEALAKEGYTEDINLAASGPGSNTWGYKKTENGKTQVAIYSYETVPTSSNPNEPLQFDCPCQVNLKIFISDPFDEK